MIRVALIEDNLSYLKAMQALIGSKTDLLLVYTAENLKNIDQLCQASPDVIILDIDLPGINGIEGVRFLRDNKITAGIFMLTVFEDDEKIFSAIKAGADGYLLKKDPPDKIIEAIEAVYRGESIINGRVARKMLDYFAGKGTTNQKELEQYNLTKREKEILQLLIAGKPYKLIAEECNISMQTLFSHTKNIYNKLNIHSRAEIAARFG
ncbi:MAG: response regulator transcription factor [Bacteroidetes bacterium]|nr:response regulator transcription factor [Bacteroidota bacterium]MBS1930556.1 response regulator transcription factor [Bacteroidota bacterium]